MGIMNIGLVTMMKSMMHFILKRMIKMLDIKLKNIGEKLDCFSKERIRGCIRPQLKSKRSDLRNYKPYLANDPMRYKIGAFAIALLLNSFGCSFFSQN